MKRIRLSYANVMSTLALFLALGGGAAIAATKFVSSAGAVRLCIASSGAVKALKTTAKSCPRGTSLVAVNQKGPRGATGEKGATGTPGQTGSQGIQGIQGVKGDPATSTASTYAAGSGLDLSGNVFSVDSAQLKAQIAGSEHAYSGQQGSGLPTATTVINPGSWVLIGQMTAGNANTATTLFCTIDVNGSPIARSATYIPASGAAGTINGSLTVVGTDTVTTAQAADISCTTDGSSYPQWSNGSIQLLPVGALN